MSVESGLHRRPLNEPGRGLAGEFMARNVYAAWGMHRSPEELATNLYHLAGNILGRAQLLAPDGLPRLEHGAIYTTPLGASVKYNQTVQDNVVTQKKLDIGGLTDIRTMLGTTKQDRAVLIGYTSHDNVPDIPIPSDIIERDLVFYKKENTTPEVHYTYRLYGEDLITALEQGDTTIPLRDLLLTLSIAELALAQPLERTAPPIT